MLAKRKTCDRTESKPPVTWLDRKDNVPIVPELARIFIYQAGERGKKVVI